MIERSKLNRIKASLELFPAVAILGPRQVGKTTLVRDYFSRSGNHQVYLDLERPSDLDKLQNAELFFRVNREKQIIIDEIQRKPDLFPLLRYEIDEARRPGRFILLGSSGPELLRQSSESLAGRLDYILLHPFTLAEVGEVHWEKLWLRGGFPEAFLAADDDRAFRWLESFLRALVERDLPGLGLSLTSLDIGRLLTMLAHHHGQPLNASKLAKSLGVSQPTIMKSLDFLEQAFVIKRLPAWSTNLKKRIVKASKLYFHDTGLLHTLLGITSMSGLMGHPVSGFSFERFVMHQVTEPLDNSVQVFFYRTQDGTESDLVLSRRNQVELCIEAKFSANPTITKSMRLTQQDLKPRRTIIVTPGDGTYWLDESIQVIGVQQVHTLMDVMKS